MTPVRINGKKLVLVGGLVIFIIAASAGVFSIFYKHALAHPASQPTSQL